MSLFHSDDLKTIVVNSINRDSGSSSNFVYSINLPANDFNRVCVKEISIPRSWYDFDVNYNSFSLMEGSAMALIEITPASYNLENLPQEIALQLTNNSPNGYTYYVSYPTTSQPQTNKFTFTCNAPVGTYIAFIFGSYEFDDDTTAPLEGCYLQFGFNIDSTNVFQDVGGVMTLVSLNSISISYINRIFLCSDLCSTEVNNVLLDCLFVGQYPPLSYCYWEALTIDTNSKAFSNTRSNSAKFWLIDEYNQSLNLNGQDFVMTLMFFKKNDTDELMKQKMLVNLLEEVELGNPPKLL